LGGSTLAILVTVFSGSIPSSGGASLHVRSTDAQILQKLQEGYSRSATFRALVDQLEGTSTIVYVERGICAFGHFKACLPHAITVVGDTRFLRILVEEGREGAPELALIGHELQHALEIAREPNIRSAEDITRLFGRIGRSTHCPRGTPDCYETSAARAAGDAVLREILGSSGNQRERR